jgi:CubicO group peptidase (beta-lactamase class C family)
LKFSIIALGACLIFAGCQSVAKNKNNDPLVKDTSVHALAVAFPKLSDDQIKKYHDELAYYFNRTLPAGRFNGVIVVAKNGQIVYERYSGFRDLRAKKDSVNEGTTFQIASTSKTFTSAAVLKLMQEGKLKLDQLVSEFFPGFPYPTVTIKMLLDHRSGLPNYLNYMEALGWNKNRAVSNEDVINSLINQKPAQAYRPDVHFNYCNTNYVLLASIVEKISRIPFPQYMKQNFFDPLQMTHTFIKTQADSATVNYSYQWNGALWRPDFSDGPYGDKNVYSTPRDLLKWDQSLYAHTILTKETTDLAFTGYSNEKPSQHNYGLGWRLLSFPSGKKVVYHNGRWHGFNSCFDRLIDDTATIIILNNRFNIGIYNIARKAYDIFGNYGGKGNGEDDNKE